MDFKVGDIVIHVNAQYPFTKGKILRFHRFQKGQRVVVEWHVPGRKSPIVYSENPKYLKLKRINGLWLIKRRHNL